MFWKTLQGKESVPDVGSEKENYKGREQPKDFDVGQHVRSVVAESKQEVGRDQHLLHLAVNEAREDCPYKNSIKAISDTLNPLQI